MTPKTAPLPSEFLSAHISDSKLFLCVEARVKWIAFLQKLWKEWLVGMGHFLAARVPCGTFGQPWRWERLGNDRSWLTLCSQGQNSSIASFGDLAFLLCHVTGMVDAVLAIVTVMWSENGRCVLKVNRHNRASEFVNIDIRYFDVSWSPVLYRCFDFWTRRRWNSEVTYWAKMYILRIKLRKFISR